MHPATPPTRKPTGSCAVHPDHPSIHLVGDAHAHHWPDGVYRVCPDAPATPAAPNAMALARPIEDLREATGFTTQALRDVALHATGMGHRGIKTSILGAIEAAQHRLKDAKAALAKLEA